MPDHFIVHSSRISEECLATNKCNSKVNLKYQIDAWRKNSVNTLFNSLSLNYNVIRQKFIFCYKISRKSFIVLLSNPNISPLITNLNVVIDFEPMWHRLLNPHIVQIKKSLWWPFRSGSHLSIVIFLDFQLASELC